MDRVSKSTLKRIAKKAGFYPSGDFLIGLRNSEIISGLAIDSAPSSTYLWTFILPAFDDLSFLHMSLGKRVATCGPTADCLDAASNEYATTIFNIRTAKELEEYIHVQVAESGYSRWARYLCYLKGGQYGMADELSSIIEGTEQNRLLLERLEHIKSEIMKGGAAGVERTLLSWASHTDAILVGAPKLFEYSWR